MAQSQPQPQDLKNSILEISKKIEDNNLIVSNVTDRNTDDVEKSNAQKVEAAREKVNNQPFLGNLGALKAALYDYTDVANSIGNERDQVVNELFEAFLKDLKAGTTDQNYDVIITNITPYINHSDWFIAFQAQYLKCMMETYTVRRAAALQTAQTALSLIPVEIDPYVSEARIRITDLIAYLHNLQYNVDSAVLNTDLLINLKSEAGLPVDGIELLNNLSYSFGIWRNHEINLILAETLKRLEVDNDSTTPGLTDMRLAQVYAEVGDFSAVKTFAQQAINASEIPAIDKKSSLLLAIGHAGLGEVKITKDILSDHNMSSSDPVSQHDQSYYLYAQALIALAEGRNLDAAKYFNQRLDTAVQKVLTATNQDTTSLLASLENSRERQAEREKSLIREAQLKAQKLEEQKKVNRLLLVLLALIAGALVLALIFARYRHRVSRLLAIKTREAESADRMKTEFLGMVSHELRTPLNGIIGIADFLHSRHTDKDVRHKTGIILKSGNILFKLIESIIDMARIDGGKFNLFPEDQPLEPALQYVAESWENEAAEKGLEYTYFISGGLDLVAHFDVSGLKKILNALLSNAIKFTDEGRVHLHVTRETAPDGKVLLQAIIADTGMGISHEVQAKLFTPFLQADSSMTRKHNGSGLSLAIMRSLARMMDGDITLISKSGRGSEFKFTALLTEGTEAQKGPADAPEYHVEGVSSKSLVLAAPSPKIDAPSLTRSESDDPIIGAVLDLMDGHEPSGRTGLHDTPPRFQDIVPTAEPVTPREDFDINAVDLNGLKVLIVEDVPSNQDVLKLLLAPHGCVCLTADDGQDALDLLANTEVDVILMDIRMPGMNGVQATRAIRDRNDQNRQVPIIALTADVEASLNAECMAAGADLFLTKPVMRKELIEAVSFVHKHQRNAQAPLLLTEVAS